jgi:hypothetical protein
VTFSSAAGLRLRYPTHQNLDSNCDKSDDTVKAAQPGATPLLLYF